MATRLNTVLRNVLADAAASQFNNGTIDVYTGAQPASPGSAPTGTLLVTAELPTPAFAAAAGGIAEKTGNWVGVAVATGDAGWFRMKSSDGTASKDGAITAMGGGGELELANISLVTGGVVVVNVASITQPESA